MRKEVGMEKKLLSYKEIFNGRMEGGYVALGDDGKLYDASYTTKYGGQMFFCIPSYVKVLGYYKKEN